jgi:hypothetical protein
LVSRVLGSCALYPIEHRQRFAVFLQPGREHRPLPQQRFVCDLDDDPVFSIVELGAVQHQQALLDQALEQRPGRLGNFVPSRHSTLRLAVVGIDACQPRE